MVDVSIVTETWLETNWNRRTGAQDHVLSQADALTKNEDDLKNEDDPKKKT